MCVVDSQLSFAHRIVYEGRPQVLIRHAEFGGLGGVGSSDWNTDTRDMFGKLVCYGGGNYADFKKAPERKRES